VTSRNSFSFPRDPQTVRAARGALRDIGGDLPAQTLHDASLCLSELVTNAIQHPGAGGDFELTLALDDERLRVEVADDGTGFDPGPPTEGDERGWGLFIVDNLSDGWGVDHGARTVVWFEIARSTGAAPAEEAGGTRREGGDDPRQDRLLRAAALRLRGRLAAP
jgi:anti-sigma regulatory factor (Ser/Thr protein kinase)